jgi:hypothetical protein
MFNRANALKEFKANLQNFQNGKNADSIPLAQQNKLQSDYPELSAEETEALLIIHNLMGYKPGDIILRCSSPVNNSEKKSESVGHDTNPNAVRETPRQEYIAKIIEPFRRQLIGKLNASTAAGDQAFALQISLAKLFPFNPESEPGKWINPISLDEINCQTPDLIIMSQAPAITKADAEAFYKTSNAFDRNNYPKDYRGQLLSAREMQSMVDQNLFSEMAPIPSQAQKKIIDMFTGLGEKFGTLLGMIFLFSSYILTPIIVSLLPFNFFLVIPFFSLALLSIIVELMISEREISLAQRLFESFLFAGVGGLFITGLIIPLAYLIPYSLTYASVISVTTFATIANAMTCLIIPITTTLIGLVGSLNLHSPTMTVAQGVFMSYLNLVVGLPQSIGKWLGKQVGRFTSIFCSNINVIPAHPRRSLDDLYNLFRNARSGIQPQPVQPRLLQFRQARDAQQSEEGLNFQRGAQIRQDLHEQQNRGILQPQHVEPSQESGQYHRQSFQQFLQAQHARQAQQEREAQLARQVQQSLPYHSTYVSHSSLSIISMAALPAPLAFVSLVSSASFSSSRQRSNSILIDGQQNRHGFFHQPNWADIPADLISHYPAPARNIT